MMSDAGVSSSELRRSIARDSKPVSSLLACFQPPYSTRPMYSRSRGK